MSCSVVLCCVVERVGGVGARQSANMMGFEWKVHKPQGGGHWCSLGVKKKGKDKDKASIVRVYQGTVKG